MKLDQHELMIYMNDDYRKNIMSFKTAQELIDEAEDED